MFSEACSMFWKAKRMCWCDANGARRGNKLFSVDGKLLGAGWWG